MLRDASLVPGRLDLVELISVDETEDDHAVDDDDPPEDVDADAPPLVEELKHTAYIQQLQDQTAAAWSS